MHTQKLYLYLLFLISSFMPIVLNASSGDRGSVASGRMQLLVQGCEALQLGDADSADRNFCGLVSAAPGTSRYHYELARVYVSAAYNLKSKGLVAGAHFAAGVAAKNLDSALAKRSDADSAEYVASIYELAASVSEDFIGDTPNARKLYRSALAVCPASRKALEATKRYDAAEALAARRRAEGK